MRINLKHMDKLTKDIVNSRISGRNIELVGNYVNNNTKTLFRCSNQHTWLAKPNNIMSRNSGCPTCAGQTPLSLSIVNNKIAHKHISMIDNYLNIDTKCKFRCMLCNAEFISTPYLMMTKSHCHYCHKRRGGFNKFRPGIFYILYMTEYNCIKYGITNNLKQRLVKHRSSSPCNVLYSKEFINGNDAFFIEQNIKQQFGGGYIPKSTLKDGWTETLSLDYFDKLISIADNALFYK